jgi:hypothetical protein
MKRLPFISIALFALSLNTYAAEEDTLQFSFGSRVWYADWELEERVSRVNLDQQMGNPEQTFKVDSDPEPFISLYADVSKGDWQLSLAYGFSDRYTFRNNRSNDSFDRTDYQLAVQRFYDNGLSLGVGLHRIENEGKTDGGQGGPGGRPGGGARSIEYSFTGPELSGGYAHPIIQHEDMLAALAFSGTMGFYMADDTAGFISAMDDAPGYAADAGLVVVKGPWHFRVGYRLLYIDDTLWSEDRLERAQGQGDSLERTVVDANETFKGAYLEISHTF